MQNVFIINFNSLYEILDEIKENLSFKIIEFDEEKNFEKDKNLDIKNSVVISKTNHKLLRSNKDIEKNFLKFKDLPITLNKLIEIINIKLIKLKFNYQSDIIIKGYKLNLNSKFFSKGNLNLKLTEKEIEIILYLNNIKTKRNVLNLQKEIWSYPENIETHTVETHIYRLRKKITNLFKDKNFILSHKDGYFIN
jgi:DNA-binding response OmpR family regulator